MSGTGKDHTCDMCACCAGVTTAEGHHTADVVVLAAGRRIPDLAAHAGVRTRLADKPATLNVYTEPAPPLLRHIVLSRAHICSHWTFIVVSIPMLVL